jgi:geranylgeranyl reductase family protein
LRSFLVATGKKRVSEKRVRPPAKSVSRSDVLIVGGGPAGCVAGILLAKQGIQAAILEKALPGYHKICGDLVGPRSLQFLDAMQIDWKSRQEEGLPIEGIQVHDETGLRSVAYLEKTPGKDPVGITLRRDLLDGFLQQKAVEAGCRLFHGMKFREIVSRGENEVLCRASRDGENHLYRVKLVFGADGIQSDTARSAGLFERRTEAMLLAVRGYYRNVAGLRNTLELYPLSDLQPGYAWVIPLSRDLANVGLGVRADVCRRDRVRLRRELFRFVAEHPNLSRRMKSAKLEGPVQGWPLTAYGSVQRLSGSHVMLLGDAGGFIDPLSGEGIFGAMQSAQIAVDVAQQAIHQGTFTAGFLARYDERCRRFFHADFGSAALVTDFLAHPAFGKPLAMWGLKKVEKNCLLDPNYARMIAGFFTGMYPRKRFLKPKWLAKTIFG